MRRLLSIGVLLSCLVAISPHAAIAAKCAPLEVASSPEKLELLTRLANEFNDSDVASSDGECVTVHISNVSSGTGATLLTDDWPQPRVNGPKPVIWSPASSAWRAVLEERRARAAKQPIAPQDGTPFMLTPLVIAMPKPMAQALGWPKSPIGFADILSLARDPQGWARYNHRDWGLFRLGKTSPNFSTSALSATVAQYYAATGKTSDLTIEDLERPDVQQFARDVESAVVHYGDTTLTFLNNLYRADQNGNPFAYASAIAVEEKSLIDYNLGNPDGILESGETPKKPTVPLVAIYPKEGTLFSDNPLIILDAPWVSEAQTAGAQRFQRFVTRPSSQRRVLQYHFRPANPDVKLAKPIARANGVDPKQPATTLDVPEPAVLARVIDDWNQIRKRARVLFVVDVSGSMGDLADPRTGASKLELAKQASLAAIEEFLPDDEVGLRIFSTDISTEPPFSYLDPVEIAPVARNHSQLTTEIQALMPKAGTPLFTVTEDSYGLLTSTADPSHINAVVLLSDGRNEDPENTDLAGLLAAIRSRTEGQAMIDVRIFTIAYGKDADQTTLTRIAEATNGAAYSAADPRTIGRVLRLVVSNL